MGTVRLISTSEAEAPGYILVIVNLPMVISGKASFLKFNIENIPNPNTRIIIRFAIIGLFKKNSTIDFI